MDYGAAHCARRSSPLILGKGAGAAPPEAAGGGGHGESCLCCVSALGIFLHSLTQVQLKRSNQRHIEDRRKALYKASPFSLSN